MIDHLLYLLYGLTEGEISIIKGNGQAIQRANDTLSWKNQWRRRDRKNASDDDGERNLAQEEQSTMRTITKGGQPAMVAHCVAQTLTNPYCDIAAMNEAMGYVPNSQTGPHYLNMTLLAGLLTETPQGWPRPTEAGRELIDALTGGATVGNANTDGVWNALLALPAYRRYLEYKVLTLELRNRTYRPAIADQIEADAREAFPGFRNRAVTLQQMLRFDQLTTDQAIGELRRPPTLEPINLESLLAWSNAQGFVRGRSDPTRAGEIAVALARAERLPLMVRDEWLTEPGQLLALMLLIAARQQGQGVVVVRGARRNGATILSRAMDRLRLCGLDIRYEQRGETLIATLVPAIALHIATAAALDALEAMRGADVAPLAQVMVAAARAELREGGDGEMRGRIAPADLASRCAEARFDGAGEFASAYATEDAPPVESAILVGPPTPLATDLPPLGRDYRFLEDAMRAHSRGGRGTVAVLLSEWLMEQRWPPQQAVNINPHLALLYLIAADLDHRAEMLARRNAGWYFANTPLVIALDERLRGLGYTVWDEAYRDDEPRQHALGNALVEQGLSVGVLRHSENPAAPLEAPARWGYYEAIDLLDAQPARRRRR